MSVQSLYARALYVYLLLDRIEVLSFSETPIAEFLMSEN